MSRIISLCAILVLISGCGEKPREPSKTEPSKTDWQRRYEEGYRAGMADARAWFGEPSVVPTPITPGAAKPFSSIQPGLSKPGGERRFP